MRIGVYGGSFDPVHLGHLVLAEQARDQLQLDQVWWIPAQVSPHKTNREMTPGKARLEMIELAIAGHAGFRALATEIDRPGPSFTIDTLSQLCEQHPGHEWWLMMGADSVHEFGIWREPEKIVQLARIAAVNRGNHPPPPLDEFRQRFGDRVDEVTMPDLDLSSTDIQDRLAQGRSVRFLVPRAVELYIEQHGIFSSASS